MGGLAFLPDLVGGGNARNHKPRGVEDIKASGLFHTWAETQGPGSFC